MGLLITCLAAALGLYYLRESEERLQALFFRQTLAVVSRNEFLVKSPYESIGKLSVKSYGVSMWNGLGLQNLKGTEHTLPIFCNQKGL